LRELICDTSSLQYLHQLGVLGLLQRLADRIVVPPAVLRELSTGRAEGHDVPVPESIDWIKIVSPSGSITEQALQDLGPGETEVLMLALERAGSIAVVDDKLAREVAEATGIQFTGTLGILLDFQRRRYIDRITPLLDHLQDLRFRLAPSVRAMILREAGE